MKNITDNNKMIARFMGYHYNPYNKYNNLFPGWVKDDNQHFKIQGNYLCRKHKDLKYHKSYDWLIPVAKECAYILLTNDENKMEVYLRDTLSNFNILSLYNEVIGVIKYINENGLYERI